MRRPGGPGIGGRASLRSKEASLVWPIRWAHGPAFGPAWSPHESEGNHMEWRAIRRSQDEKNEKHCKAIFLRTKKCETWFDIDLTIWPIHLDRRYVTSLKSIERQFANADFNSEHPTSYWTRLACLKMLLRRASLLKRKTSFIFFGWTCSNRNTIISAQCRNALES